MSWLELTVAARAEAVDWVAALLAASGHDGRVDVMSAAGAARPFTLRFHLPDDRAGRMAAARVDGALDPLRRMDLVGDIATDHVEQPSPPAPLPPRKLTERFLLLPTDAPAHDGLPEACGTERDALPDTPEPVGPNVLPLRIRPSAAFGSGLHPATVAVLRLVERHAPPGGEALDLGSGSGILSVALARLSLRVLAVDNDPLAVEATRNAADLNGVADRVEAAHASLGGASRLGHWLGLGELPPTPPIGPDRRFDLVAANILSRVHAGLAADYRRVLRPGGVLIVGGFTRGDDEADVAAALGEAGFRPLDRTRLGDFVALARRPEPNLPSGV